MGNDEKFEEQDVMEKSPKDNRRPVLLIFGGVLLAGVLVVAALVGVQMLNGSKSQNLAASPVSSLAPNEALLVFAKCMRDNGVPNFPDPVDDGINLDGTGLDPNMPEFQAAEKACESVLPYPAAGLAAAGDLEWEKVVPGGNGECADGSEFAFFERRADRAKVVFYLDGGGVCFDATSCANANAANTGERAGPDYDPNVDDNPAREGGMFDFGRADNPFLDYSFIYVPLCTADAHLGNATHEYSPELTVEHKGFVNGTAALNYLAENYPDAAQVVVLGKTAGSVAAPIYGGLVADLFPDAQVTVFGAQSGAFLDDPDFNAEVLGELWGAYDNLPDWEVNEGLTARDWGTTQFWIQAGLHDPDIVMARFDYAFDRNAASAVEMFGVDPSNLVDLIDANEAAIEAAGVVQHSYTAPGDGHGILEFETFYEMEVNGVRLVDWVQALSAGEPLDDVHCDKCETE
jgi:Pectinacetylesterase